jgi:hypothetical protein
VSVLFVNLKHLLEGAWLRAFVILALFAFAHIRAIDTRLVALTIFLLAERLPAVAAFEVPFLVISHSEHTELGGLSGNTK